MGIYIETGSSFDKAAFLQDNYGAKVVSVKEASEAINNNSVAVVCVKSNPNFEAAGFCYNKNEFDAFNWKYDDRPTKWLIMRRDIVEMLTNFSIGQKNESL